MKDRPEGLAETEVRGALSAWRIDPARWAYAPVGFGDYHWTASDTRARRWFVTVADLVHKEMYGPGTETAFHGLRRAMDTASALREGPAADIVVAPLRTERGETVRRLGSRYAVSVFPLVDGESGRFGAALGARERGEALDLLAVLHRSPPPAASPVHRPEPPSRARLEEALGDTGRSWGGGPYAEPARALLADRARGLRRRLEELDRRARELAAKGAAPVLTHGEPHPGNLLRTGDRWALADWDTVGLAVPERDLWLVAEGPEDLARYEDATGHRPDPSALAFYRLRWDLDDVAVYTGLFRSSHARTPDTDEAWSHLNGTLDQLTDDARG